MPVSTEGTKESPAMQVKEGAVAAYPFGPPFKPRASVMQRPSHPWSEPTAQRRTSLRMRFTGSGYATVSALLINGEQPAKPKFVIATPPNGIVERGTFEYG